MTWPTASGRVGFMVDIFFLEKDFVPYGPSHWAMFVAFAVGAFLTIRWGRAHRGTPQAKSSSRLFAVAILAFQGPLQVYSMLPRHWDLATSLPFQLCDLAWMVAVYALWTHRPWASGLLYYWGLTLTSQALVTPDLDFDFPHLQFIMFWGGHCLVVWAAIYVTWGLGSRPSWRDYLLAVAATVGWGVAMLGFNTLASTNYLYVNEKPPGASVLDLLGEWPWYLFWELVLGLTVWALITLPWRGLPHRFAKLTW